MAVALVVFLAMGSAASASGGTRAVAEVGSTRITFAQYRHWERVARRGAPHALAKARRRTTMTFLITEDWVQGEAAERGISVSAEEVNARFAELRRHAFPNAKAFRRFLRSTGQTVADLKFREKLDLLTARLRVVVTGSLACPDRPPA